jgi:hypothetical protein
MRDLNDSPRPRAKPRHISFIAALLCLASGSAIAGDSTEFLPNDPIGVPMRVRNFTYPSLFFLGLASAPVAPLGKAGVFGVGLTEDFFHYANTPDIGIHLSWGDFFGRGRDGR